MNGKLRIICALLLYTLPAIGRPLPCPERLRSVMKGISTYFDQQFQQAVERNEARKAAALARGVDPAHAPDILTQGRRTRGVVVVVHGLGGSPKQMRQVTKAWLDAGYNVVTVLLHGHGSEPEHLIDLAAQPTSAEVLWNQNVEEGVAIAEGLGGKVILSSYSVGATLSIEFVLKHPDRVAALSLHSPMLSISPLIQRILSESRRSNSPWMVPPHPDLSLLNDDGYTRLPKSGYGPVTDTISRINQNFQGENVRVPTRMVVSEFDKVAAVEGSLKLAKDHGVSEVQLIPKSKRVGHEDTILGPEADLIIREQVEWANSVLED